MLVLEPFQIRRCKPLSNDTLFLKGFEGYAELVINPIVFFIACYFNSDAGDATTAASATRRAGAGY